MDEKTYVTKRLDDQMNWHDRKSGNCQKWHKGL